MLDQSSSSDLVLVLDTRMILFIFKYHFIDNMTTAQHQYTLTQSQPIRVLYCSCKLAGYDKDDFCSRACLLHNAHTLHASRFMNQKQIRCLQPPDQSSPVPSQVNPEFSLASIQGTNKLCVWHSSTSGSVPFLTFFCHLTISLPAFFISCLAFL